MQRRLLLTLPLLASLPARAAESTALPSVHVLPEPLALPGLGRSRTLRLCLPPSYALEPQRRYPVIYMHDGQNLFDAATSYAGEWGVDETCAQLARDTGFEALVVGIDNGREKRTTEMARADDSSQLEANWAVAMGALSVWPSIRRTHGMSAGISREIVSRVRASSAICSRPVASRSAEPEPNKTSDWNTKRSSTMRMPGRLPSTSRRRPKNSER